MTVELKVPSVGESITEVYIGQWRKQEGDRVEADESVVELESEKATFDAPAPAAGVIDEILKQEGERAEVGEVIARIRPAGEGDGRRQAPAKERQERPAEPEKPEPEKPEPERERKTSRKRAAREAAEERPSRKREPERRPAREEERPRVMPAAARLLAEHDLDADQVEPTGPGGRLLKEDVLRHIEAGEAGRGEPPRAEADRGRAEVREQARRAAEQRREEDREPAAPPAGPGREEDVVPMSPIRRRIAERLVQARQQAALLTTFNEIDMSAVQALRRRHQAAFQEKYGVKLGVMSFFVKAAIDALTAVPQVNAEIRGTDIVYRNYYDIGIAIGGGKGLVVPVLRSAERMSFAEIEQAIADLARRAQSGELRPDELRGGTFTISNGGIYGSLLSTPIVNPPQSGVLGMHAIQERPVVCDGQVVARPMMYVALTYDHRLIDGREAVTFLRRIKEVIEEPARLLIEV